MSIATDPPLQRQDQRSTLWREIASGRHRSVLMLVGSAVSYSECCHCAGVRQIRDTMVLGPIGARHHELEPLTTQMRHNGARPPTRVNARLSEAVDALPFEQFMGSVDAVSHEVACGVVGASCGGAADSSPNANHQYIAAISCAMLRAGLCDRLTIATTNYDQCLERAEALADLGTVARAHDHVHVRTASRGALQLLKLHGCVSDLDSCVFTMSQYARALLDATRVPSLTTALGAPTLIVVLGYSFSDPDLRPLWHQLTSGRRVAVFWNERRPSEPATPTNQPAEVLRREFLRQFDHYIHHGSLFDEGASEAPYHLLRYISMQLDVNRWPLPKYGISDVITPRACAYVDTLTAEQAAEVLARVVGSCCRGDAALALGRIISRSTAPSPAAVRAFLDQFGHCHRVLLQARAARGCRRRFNDETTQLVARSIESFSLSIRGGPKALLGLFAVLVCRSDIRQADQEARMLYRHYRDHLLCKIVQKGSCVIPRWILAVAARSGMALYAQQKCHGLLTEIQHVRNCLSQVATPPKLIEMRDLANGHLLASQMFLLASRPEHAEEHARNAELFYSCAGFMNGALQANRALGWAMLGQGRRHDAIRIHGLGLWRALETDDSSLRPKLGVDLLRSLDVGIEDAEPSEHLASAAGEVSRQLADGRNPDVTDLQKYVGSLYTPPERGRIRRFMRRTREPRLYPLILPPEPSRPVPVARGQQPI